MSLSKSKCLYSNNSLHFLMRAVPLDKVLLYTVNYIPYESTLV